MLNTENISEQCMKDEIVKDVLKALRAEKINDESAYKRLKTLVKSKG